jgi:hypothetical protein
MLVERAPFAPGVLLSVPANGSYQVMLTIGATVTGQNFGAVLTNIAVPLTLPPSDPFPAQGNANADYVEALYRSILDRNADPAGLANWSPTTILPLPGPRDDPAIQSSRSSGWPTISFQFFFCSSLKSASILSACSLRIFNTFGRISSGLPPDWASFISGSIFFCIS